MGWLPKKNRNYQSDVPVFQYENKFNYQLIGKIFLSRINSIA